MADLCPSSRRGGGSSRRRERPARALSHVWRPEGRDIDAREQGRPLLGGARSAMGFDNQDPASRRRRAGYLPTEASIGIRWRFKLIDRSATPPSGETAINIVLG